MHHMANPQIGEWVRVRPHRSPAYTALVVGLGGVDSICEGRVVVARNGDMHDLRATTRDLIHPNTPVVGDLVIVDDPEWPRYTGTVVGFGEASEVLEGRVIVAENGDLHDCGAPLIEHVRFAP